MKATVCWLMVFQKIHGAILKKQVVCGCITTHWYQIRIYKNWGLSRFGIAIKICSKNILQFMYFIVSPEKFTLSGSSRKTFTNMKRTTTLFNSYIMHLLMYRGFCWTLIGKFMLNVLELVLILPILTPSPSTCI